MNIFELKERKRILSVNNLDAYRTHPGSPHRKQRTLVVISHGGGAKAEGCLRRTENRVLKAHAR